MKRWLLQQGYVLGVICGGLLLIAGCGGGSSPIKPNPVPAITTLSPASATAGAAAQTLTINGSNFISSSTVTYNAVAHTATYASATQLTIQLTTSDQATAGTYAVVVTNPSPGGGVSNSVNFTVNNPIPAITSLSPSSSAVGAPAQTLTINGTNFVANSTVTYNAASHTATYVSATQLSIQLSAADQATAGTFAVVVTNPSPGGGASNSVNFTIKTLAPTITSLSPTSATAGAAAQTLTINGTNFGTWSTVTYNSVAHTATFVSATQLTIQLTAADQATAGSYPVVVTNPTPGGGTSNSVNFTVNNPTPMISSLSPSSATAGAAAQTLTINGTNFVSTSMVTYNSVAHTATFVSATQLTIQLSAADQATGGTYAVVVTNPTPGGGASNSVSFTVNNPTPTISSLSPTSATAGAAAQTLTINGTNFVSTSMVMYNSVAHTVTFVSSTQLTIMLSASDQATAGTYPVVVTNPAPGGGASNSVNFTVTAATNPVPSISSLSPSSALAGTAAQTLTITGTGFITTSTVTYNGVAHSAKFVSATQLTIQLTAADQASGGTYPVVVTNPTPGGGVSNSVNFTVDNPTPTISSLSPSSATAGAAGQTLTINGTNFVSTSTVTYNSVAQTTTFVSSTQLTIMLSASDQANAGTYGVVVTNPPPGGGASNALNFTVTAASNTLKVTTTALPNGFLGISYAAQAAASGGAQPYTWSVSAGVLPPGLTLAPSTGVISGVPVGSTGTLYVTLQVTDSKSATASSPSIPVTIGNDTISVCESGNESALLGQYAFNLIGYNSSGFSAVVGSLHFNGSGGITGGEVDINTTGAASETNTTIIATGSSYTVGASNRGCATFVTATGTTFTTRFTLGAFSGGLATQGRIMEFDPASSSSFIAAGQILLQTTASFASGPAGSFVHLVTGWDSTAGTRVACAGVLTRTATSGAAGNLLDLDQSCNDGGSFADVTVSGTWGSYTAPDSNGRFTELSSVSEAAMTNAEYMVSANESLVVSVLYNDANNIIIAGESYLQTGAGSFTTASVSGGYAWYENGLEGTLGAWTEFGYFEADGTGTSLDIEAYADAAGSIGSASGATCTYTVNSNGHMTINGGTTCPDPPLAYLISNSQAVLLSEDARVEAGMAFLQNLPSAFSLANMPGAFFGGTTEVVNQNSRAENDLVDLQNSTTFPNMFVLGDKANVSPSNELADQFTEELASVGDNGILLTQSTPTAAPEVAGIVINLTSFLIVNDIGTAYPTFVLFGTSTPDNVAISLAEPTTAQTVATNADVPITVAVTGTTNTGVTWLFNGMQSGSGAASSFGSVSGSGTSFTYTAPSSVPPLATFDITAVSNTDASKTVSFSVTVTDPSH